MRKAGPVSRTTHYRRKRQAAEMDCSVDDLPDFRGKHRSHVTSTGHWRWNHGRMIDDDGYVKARVGAKHPLADANGYVFEHTLIWVAAGNHRPMRPQTLHHRNRNKQDNRVGNLVLVTVGQHAKLHNKERLRDNNGKFQGRETPEDLRIHEFPDEAT